MPGTMRQHNIPCGPSAAHSVQVYVVQALFLTLSTCRDVPVPDSTAIHTSNNSMPLLSIQACKLTPDPNP